VKADLRRKLANFEFAITLWNFEDAFILCREFVNFPVNAHHLTKDLMQKHGNCGSQRTGYAYVGVPKSVQTIMEIASPWLDDKRKGGKKKPKAIAV